METIIDSPLDQGQVKRLKRNRMFLAATIGGTAPMICVLSLGGLMKAFPQLKGSFLPIILMFAIMGGLGYLIKLSMRLPRPSSLNDYRQANKNLFRLALALLAALPLLLFLR